MDYIEHLFPFIICWMEMLQRANYLHNQILIAAIAGVVLLFLNQFRHPNNDCSDYIWEDISVKVTGLGRTRDCLQMFTFTHIVKHMWVTAVVIVTSGFIKCAPIIQIIRQGGGVWIWFWLFKTKIIWVLSDKNNKNLYI